MPKRVTTEKVRKDLAFYSGDGGISLYIEDLLDARKFIFEVQQFLARTQFDSVSDDIAAEDLIAKAKELL